MKNKAIYRKHLNIKNRENRQGKIEQSKKLYELKYRDIEFPMFIRYHMLRGL